VINLIETLFALAAVSVLAAVILRLAGRRTRARQVFLFALLIAAAALFIEIYVRL
jgi:recombinational DNA repair protein (RecF pathway)